jgi:ferritin-like protein
MAEQAGLDVNVLIGKLVAAAGAEFTTFCYYTILRVNAIGLEGEGMKPRRKRYPHSPCRIFAADS